MSVQTPDSSRRPARRTIIEGAAWSVPVLATAVAAPLAAASTPTVCVYQPAQVISATAANTASRVAATITIPVPAGAQTVRYTVIGGRGGSQVGGGDSINRLPAVLTGEFPASLVAGGSLQLIAGSAGAVGNNVNIAGLGGVGYGNGGNGAAYGAGVGGGGAASAILFGGAPLIVAGGGGGDANSLYSPPALNVDDPAGQGHAGLPGGVGGQGIGNHRETGQPSGPSYVTGGGGGTQTGPGAGGTFGGPRSRSFLNGNPGVARNGGNGLVSPENTAQGSGGGGGGYFGGGGGSTLYWDGVVSGASQGFSILNSQGGGGSSYRAANIVATSETIALVNGGQGFVQVEFCVLAPSA